MPVFFVTVQRVERREHTFRIEADDRQEAHDLGLTAAGDYDFHDSSVSSADEEVTTITLGADGE